MKKSLPAVAAAAVVSAALAWAIGAQTLGNLPSPLATVEGALAILNAIPEPADDPMLDANGNKSALAAKMAGDVVLLDAGAYTANVFRLHNGAFNPADLPQSTAEEVRRQSLERMWSLRVFSVTPEPYRMVRPARAAARGPCRRLHSLDFRPLNIGGHE